MAHQVDIAAVLQPKNALSQQQRHLKGDAVIAIMPGGRLSGQTQGVVGDGGGGPALPRLIPGYPVVVQCCDAYDNEQRTRHSRLRPERDTAQQN